MIKLRDNIQNRVKEHLGGIKVANSKMANKTGINVRLIRAWENKTRTARPYQWKQFTKVFKIKDAQLNRWVKKFNTVMQDHFESKYKDYHNLAYYIAKKYGYTSFDLDTEDLVNTALAGIWNRYDEYIDFKFKPGTFIQKALGRVIYLYKKNQYYISNRTRPKNKNIIERIKEGGVPGVKIDKHNNYLLFKETENPSYELDRESVFDDGGSTSQLWEFVSDGTNLENSLESKMAWKYLLSFLEGRDREIIDRRFRRKETLDSVGKRFKLTRERIRQIQDAAILKLRKRLSGQSKNIY